MASPAIGTTRLCIRAVRSQYQRTGILAWRSGRRFQTTTIDAQSSQPLEPLAANLLKSFPDGPPEQSSRSTDGSSIAAQATPTARRPPRVIMGKVTSAGKMSKTVRVDRPVQEWNNYLRKFFKTTKHYLVHDPADSLRVGDQIAFSSLPVPKGDQVSHVVRQILVPFGVNIDQRPPIPDLDQLRKEHESGLSAKRERRALRRKAEDGDEEAKRRVKEEGIAVREIKKGTGRGKKTTRVLERNANPRRSF